MGDNLQKMAADALLERGVGLKIPAPFLYRLFGRKVMELKIRRLYLGTLLYLSDLAGMDELQPLDVGADRTRLIQEMGSPSASLPLPVITANMERVTRCVAACLLNGKWKIRLFAPWLSRVLRRRCTPDQLQEIVMWLFAYGRAEAFTITTILLREMMVTPPRNMGPKEKRS